MYTLDCMYAGTTQHQKSPEKHISNLSLARYLNFSAVSIKCKQCSNQR